MPNILKVSFSLYCCSLTVSIINSLLSCLALKGDNTFGEYFMFVLHDESSSLSCSLGPTLLTCLSSDGQTQHDQVQLLAGRAKKVSGMPTKSLGD